MVVPSPQHGDAVQAFCRWMDSPEAKSPGIGGPSSETECSYIPQYNLESYFKEPRRVENLLDEVLDGKPRQAVDANYIRSHCARSFAILLSIGQGSLICLFHQYDSLRDQKLPHHSRPANFPVTKPDVFEDFKSAQWQFCAPRLEVCMSETFKEEIILPIIRRETIGKGGSAIVSRIVVDESYNLLRPKGSSPPSDHGCPKNTFALKTYQDSEAQEDYTAERNTYGVLKWAGKPCPHIVAHFGNFIHGKSRSIILEYADKGTLEDYMRNTEWPTAIRDVLLLWSRLFDVIAGISFIHGKHGTSSSASHYLTGMHQDIKPTNILVFSGDTDSPYDVHFKVGDLGLVHFKPVTCEPNDETDFDAFGTRAYGAPETDRTLEDIESSPLQVTKAVDMYSFGCVLSEMAVWMHHGWKRVIEYRRRRSLEIQEKGGPEGEHKFHFEGELLEVVESTHRDIRQSRRTRQYPTPYLMDLFEDMLQKPIERPAADFAFGKLKRLVKKLEQEYGAPFDTLGEISNGSPLDTSPRAMLRPTTNMLTVEPPPPLSNDQYSTPPSPSPRSLLPPDSRHRKSTSQSSIQPSLDHAESRHSEQKESHILSDPQPPNSNQSNIPEGSQKAIGQRPRENPPRPTLSLAEGHEWKTLKKSGRWSVLQGDENLTHLRGRDHMFLIDTSETMKQHRANVASSISLLAYLLKGLGNDGLDMFFTTDSRKVRSKKSFKLKSAIHQQQFKGVSDMRGRLQSILQERINGFGAPASSPKCFSRRSSSYSQRPLICYIFTDAMYQPTNVGRFIQELAENMRIRGLSKEHVAFSFIRFGDDPEGIARLDTLDHGLGLGDRDNVDHTPWDGNVWKQLIGPINDWYDDDHDP